MPGVLVEVTSPQLIEKVRSTTTDTNGVYRLTNLPVGTYSVTFTLEGFTKQQQNNVVLSSGFTAPVNATMAVGQLAETLVVSAEAPAVDVTNARQAVTFEGDALRELPTARNINSLLNLTPGISSRYAPGGGFGAPGVCVGGLGTFCNPGLDGFNVGDPSDGTTMAQGRVMVDGQVINSGAPPPIGGVTGGYTADIANAQEVNIQLSGALGESETGGASINIVPRTGGNRYAGEFNTTYTRGAWFDRNTANYSTVPALFQSVVSDHDVSGAYGGPIKRDRLWFYSVGRTQGAHKLPAGGDFWPNLHEGKWGFNYQPDRSQPKVEYKNMWKNVNARITWQASQKNKFNIFWDEQDFCQDPCLGVVSIFTSPESWWSVSLHPNRIQQVSWTNPLTNKILLDAGLSRSYVEYNLTSHREYRNYTEIPRITECGNTAGRDDVASRVNQSAGSAPFGCSAINLTNLTSGSLNSGLGGGAELRKADSYRTRASIAYVTGSHNAKVGYEGGFFKQEQTSQVNDSQLTYYYLTPATSCLTNANPLACGQLLPAQFPNDPFNRNLHPVPNQVTYNTGQLTAHDRVSYASLYAQDQWTLKRLTISGAVRYDHATSRYPSSTVGPNQFVPVQANGENFYTIPEWDGVKYNDLTPRWGVAWDIFGTGKTSLKYNGGKYLTAASISGIYSTANPLRRTVNSLTRNWNDIDNDRIVDCNLMDFSAQPECPSFGFGADTARFGRDPFGIAPANLQTTQCGRQTTGEPGIPDAVVAYCDAYGDNLLSGWGVRQNEWQHGLGIQHEILPRLSGEFTWNRRSYHNLTSTDQLNVGCDRFNGVEDVTACQQGYLDYVSRSHDFYSVVAPLDPRLPGGGGYTIIGLNTDKASQPTNQPNAVTINPANERVFNGFDTNFVWRGPRGFRINGGTSTGRTQRDTCFAELDNPNVRGREGREYEAGCRANVPWQTRINGSASYVIPWVDVLVSSVFQSLPGVNIGASLTYNKDQVIWASAAQSRLTMPCSNAANGVGCFGITGNTTTANIPLLLSNEIIGERTTLFDVKFAKNIRFANKRAVIGVDIYNVANSDAIQGYNGTYTVDNPATPAVEVNNWMQPTSVVQPRFARLSVQFSF
jgi:hypothetical protein